jgi:hypothetical protein
MMMILEMRSVVEVGDVIVVNGMVSIWNAKEIHELDFQPNGTIDVIKRSIRVIDSINYSLVMHAKLGFVDFGGGVLSLDEHTPTTL